MAAADGAAVALDQYTAHVNKERADLKALNANTKATLTKTKEDLTKELAAAKDAYANAGAGYGKLKSKAIALEADKTAMKGQVTVIADAIAALDKKAAAALVEKREMWSTISTIQSDITTSLARASYLEKEGFAVDPENVGALVKMHYKLHSYVTYKLKKGKK
jgi:chromosome segregation ATPase